MAFIFGGNTGLTYDEMMQRRALSGQYFSDIGNPDTVGEGLSALGKGLAAGLLGRSANKAEKAGKEAAQQRAQSVLGQLFGASLQPASYSPAPQASTGAVQQQTPGQSVAIDTMAALGKAPADGGWLKYSNQGAIRNKPINENLQTAMSFLPELGVTMEVFSGGQDAEGPHRTGSPRHDHGNAADVFFYKDGRRLDWNNPDDRPLFEQIVQRGKAAGITGFGAGDGYMQPGSMHIGYGNPGVWGAGGKGENAAEWLRAAYNGGSAPVVQTVGGGQIDPQAAIMSMGGGTDPAAVMAVLSDPYLDEGTRSMLGSLFQQQIQRRNQMTDPAYQMDMQAKQLELQRAQMEIDAMGQPQVPDELRERQALAEAAGLNPGTPEYQQFILNGETAGSDMPSQFQALDLQAQAAGLMPGTEEYKNFMLSNGSAGAPAAFVALDMQAQAAGFKPGTPEYQNFMATRGAGLIAESKAVGEAKGQAQIDLPSATAQAQQSLDLIDSIRNDPALPSITGSIQGGLLPAGIPGLTGGQAGADLGVKIEQLQGTAFLQAFESLKGAGQITEIEGQKAEAAIARLKRAQSTEAYQAALDDLAGIIRSGLGRSQSKAGVAPQAAPQALPQATPQAGQDNDPLGLFK